MRTREIAAKYDLDREELEKFIKDQELSYTSSFAGMYLDDDYDIDDLVRVFKEDKEERLQAARARKEKRMREKAEKNAELAKILITSGFNFDGYKIVKYSGYISGDDVIQISRGKDGIFSNAANAGDALSKSLVKIRRNALAELKEAAYDLGCNAVIGVDFDYITLEPETANITGGTTYMPYVFCVTANGNAVVIEKIED